MERQQNAILRIEASECPRELPPVELTLKGVGGARLGEVEIELDQVPAPADEPSCRSDHDPAEPGREELRIAQALERLPAGQQTVLDCVRGILLVAGDEPRGAQGDDEVRLY
jgi:hypothetical protein